MLGAFAGPASAADPCPNAAVRAQQASTHLPQCRAYERVTPDDKNGARLNSTTYLAADGNGLMFYATSPVLGAAGAGNTGIAVARRTADGWVAENADPGFGQRRYNGVSEVMSPAAASADLTRALYATTYPWHPGDQAIGNLRVSQSVDVYRREVDGTMTWITMPVELPHTENQPANLIASNDDLSRVLTWTQRRLTTDVPDTTRWHLYLHVDGRPMQLVSRGLDGEVLPGGANQGAYTAMTMSRSGEHVTFNDGTGQLVRFNAAEPARARTVRFVDLVTEITGRTCAAPSAVTLRAKGVLRFSCQSPLTDEAPEGERSTYDYDLDAGTIDFVDPTSPTPLPEFFETADALVPEDRNGTVDVYQRIDGEPRLITTGTSPHAAKLAGATADGTSVFFHTAESLVLDDQDSGTIDVYVARVNGGFLLPPTAAVCQADCQGAPLPTPAAPPVASLSFVGPGNLLDVEPPAEVRPLRTTAPSKAVTGASASVRVGVAEPGEIRVSGSGLRATTKRVSKAGTVRMTVRLSQRSRARLQRKGRVSVVARVRFVPATGKSQTQRVRLSFRKQTKKQGASRAGAARTTTNGKGGR